MGPGSALLPRLGNKPRSIWPVWVGRAMGKDTHTLDCASRTLSSSARGFRAAPKPVALARRAPKMWIKTPCLIVDQKSADGPYFHWERGK
jgi:hypothetical protein